MRVDVYKKKGLRWVKIAEVASVAAGERLVNRMPKGKYRVGRSRFMTNLN